MYEHEAIREALFAAGISIDPDKEKETLAVIVDDLHRQKLRLTSDDGPSFDD